MSKETPIVVMKTSFSALRYYNEDVYIDVLQGL